MPQKRGKSQPSDEFIVLAVPDVTNPFFTNVAKGAEEAAAARGYTMLIANCGSAASETALLGVIKHHGAAGLLINPSEDDASRLDALRATGVPVVLLDFASAAPDVCSVSVDNVEGGRLVAQHLLAQGHKRVALITGPLRIQQCAQRREGLRLGMEKQGVDPDQAIVDVFVPYLTQHAGASVVPQILANDVTAVFCLNDLLALGALGALMDQGVDVPGEMAVIGYDDLEFASALHVPLSSVRQPMHELGHKAATLLIDELQPTGTHRHRREQLRPQLVTRASTSSR